MRVILLAAVLFAAVHPLSGQQLTGWERKLVPVLVSATEPLPGAAGSLWTTRFALLNVSAQDSYVLGHFTGEVCTFTCEPLSVRLPPAVTWMPRDGAERGEGRFFFVTAERADDLVASLRVQDLSRNSETHGTTIPVVGDDEFARRIDLLDLVGDRRFRVALRIYGFDNALPTTVTIGIYRTDPHGSRVGPPDELVQQLILPLSLHPSATRSIFRPLSLFLSDLSVFIPLPDHFRLQIEAVEAGRRLWAFVSVTHNETQHVTVVTP